MSESASCANPRQVVRAGRDAVVVGRVAESSGSAALVQAFWLR
ncbi:hypothetical protein [Saccharothrix sp.]|nr:hypothetical protein [Saccharothrix sp.]